MYNLIFHLFCQTVKSQGGPEQVPTSTPTSSPAPAPKVKREESQQVECFRASMNMKELIRPVCFVHHSIRILQIYK